MKAVKYICKTVFVVSTLLLLNACGNKQRLKEQPPVALELVTGVGFQQVFDEVIKNKCLECHSVYDDYQVVASQSQKMLAAVVSGRMPKGKPALDERLQALLQSWVKDGAPLVPGGEEAQKIPLEPNFESIRINFLVPKCLACHSGESNAPGPVDIDFSSYEKLLATNELYKSRTGFALFDQDAAEESDFTFILTDTGPGGEPMPPRSLPGDSSYVSPGDATAEEVGVIIEWMKLGLPQN